MTTRWEPSAIVVLRDIIERYSDTYEDFGLRCLTVYRDDVAAPIVGDILPASSVWIDGNPTDDDLGGTSAIQIWSESGNDITLDRAAKMLGDYWGRYVVVIGGEQGQYGQDDGEIIVRNATVLAVFDRGAVCCDREVWA